MSIDILNERQEQIVDPGIKNEKISPEFLINQLNINISEAQDRGNNKINIAKEQVEALPSDILEIEKIVFKADRDLISLKAEFNKSLKLLDRIKNSTLGKIARRAALASSLFMGAQNIDAQQATPQEPSESHASSGVKALLPENYSLSEKNFDKGYKVRARQLSPKDQLEYDINDIKLNMSNAYSDAEKAECEQFLANPSLNTKKVGRNVFLNNDIKENEEIFKKTDKKIERMAEQIKSRVYLQRLMKEFDISKEEAKKHQLVRLNNLLSGTYSLVEYGSPCFEVSDDVVNTEIDTDEYTPYHEILGHKSVYGIKGIPQKTKDIFKDSYKSIDKNSKSFKRIISVMRPGDEEKDFEILNDYYGKSQEQYARKKSLDIEMEDLGIKKYGDKFTKDTFDKLMKFYDEGKLSEDAYHFIDTNKEEFFETIFNDISYNNDKENDTDLSKKNLS